MVSNISIEEIAQLEGLPPPGPYPSRPSVVWQRVLGPIRLLLAWSTVGAILSVGTLFAIVTLGYRRERYFHRVAMACCQAVMWFQRVDVRFVGFERLNSRKARIVCLNHISQLDMFAAATLLPPGGTPIAKREILWVPFIGLFFWIFNVIMIDRGNPERSRRSITRAGARIRDDQASVYIAPEGTRSKDGKLRPFKMGVFHLAQAAGAPIVPIVLRGAAECLPKGSIIALPGVVEIRVYDEISTADYTKDNLKEKRTALERFYAEALGESPPQATPPSA